MSTNLLRNVNCFALAALQVVLWGTITQAGTVAHWRFEDDPGFLLDSSGNGHHMTGGTLTEGTHQFAIPGSGDGSSFPTTIPVSGDANAFTTFGDLTGGADYGSVPDSNDFTPGAFTIEAFLNTDTTTNTFQMFAGHWGVGTDRSWGAGLTNDRLTVWLGNSTGTSFTTYQAPSSNFDVDAGKDYYYGVSWDGSLSGGGNNGLTFHIQNLTDGGSLISESADHTLATLHNSSQLIAVRANTSAGHNAWDGWLDELRFSNEVLSADQLLIFQTPSPVVPEPSSMVLLLGVLGFVARSRRARRCTSKPGRVS